MRPIFVNTYKNKSINPDFYVKIMVKMVNGQNKI